MVDSQQDWLAMQAQIVAKTVENSPHDVSAAGGSVLSNISLYPSTGPICAASSWVCHRRYKVWLVGWIYCP